MLIGAVQVLHLRQRPGAVDGRRQLRRQLLLSLDGGLYLLPPLLQIPKIVQPVLQLPQGGVVHAAVQLLPVAGDEGNGVALIQQVDDVLHMDRRGSQLLRQKFRNGLHSFAPFVGENRDGGPSRSDDSITCDTAS